MNTRCRGLEEGKEELFRHVCSQHREESHNHHRLRAATGHMAWLVFITIFLRVSLLQRMLQLIVALYLVGDLSLHS